MDNIVYYILNTTLVEYTPENKSEVMTMRKTKLIALLLVVAMIASMVVPGVAAAGTYTVSIVDYATGAATINANAGDDITLVMKMSNNPGVSGVYVNIDYPEEWTVKAHQDMELFAGKASTTPGFSPLTENPFGCIWLMPSGTKTTLTDTGKKLSTDNGDLFLIQLSIPEDAATGTYTVDLDTSSESKLVNGNFAFATKADGTIDPEVRNNLTLATESLTVNVTGATPVSEACPKHTDVTTWTDVAAADWAAGGAITTGHYKLTGDVAISAALTIAEGQTVCIDLAGFDITAPGTGIRVIESSGVLTITDSAETDGVISGGYRTGNSDSAEHHYGGNILVTGANAALNLYGGTVSGGSMVSGGYNYHIYGGNIGLTEGATLNIHGGTVTGGSITVNQQGTAIHGGGNIYAADSTVNIYGGTISNGTVTARYSNKTAATRKAYGAGGNIAVKNGTLNIEGGLIDNGSLDVYCKSTCTTSNPKVEAQAYGGNIYCAGTTTATISGGTISNGTVECAAETVGSGTLDLDALGGNIYNESTMTVSGTATITTGELVPDNTYAQGGNIYNRGSLTLGGSAVISDGVCTTSASRGGNIFNNGTFTMNSGTISGGTAGWGANLMSRKDAVTTIAGGTITGGSADKSVVIQCGILAISGGTIENSEENNAMNVNGTEATNGAVVTITGGIIGDISINRASQVSMYGGTIGALTEVAETATCVIYNGVTGSDVNAYRADCACVLDNGNGTWNVWHTGATDGTCATCAYNYANVTLCTGKHTYVETETAGTVTCSGCDDIKTGIVALVEGNAYTDLSDALAAAVSGNTVTLVADTEEADVRVNSGVTLDLNGKILTAGAATAASAGAHIIDGNGNGKLKVEQMEYASFMAGNDQLPVYNDGAYTFEKVTFKSQLETTETSATYKFYIDSEAEKTLIDNAILAGNDVKINVSLAWTYGGESSARVFTLEVDKLVLLANNWDTKMIVLNISYYEGVEITECTAQVVSGGVTVEA